MINIALVILGLPLLAFLLIVFVTRSNKLLSAWLAITAMAIAVLLALFAILPATLAGQTDHLEINWLRLLPSNAPATGGIEQVLRLGVAIDPLAAIMLIVVTVVSTPSAPIPRCRLQSSVARSGDGGAAPGRPRKSSRTKSFPSPWSLAKRIGGPA